MTVYESMAHTLIHEHGRKLFTRANETVSFNSGFSTRFWRWLMVAYGDQLYEVPKQVGLPPIIEAGRARPYNFPAYTISSSMRAGLSPTQLMKFPTVGGFNHQYTPLHLGTAMLRHGRPSDLQEADLLLSVTFMRSVYPTRAPEEFAAHAYVNPFRPEHFGRKPIDIELLTRPDGELYVLDELGNAAWFPDAYLKRVLQRSDAAYWYSKLGQLNAVHGRWTSMIQTAAAYLLRHKKDSFRVEYRNSADYIRSVTRSVAEGYLKDLKGAREALCVVRQDAPTAEMARGLKCLAQNHNDRTSELLRFIGRPLTFEDFAKLSPKQLLTILYYAPYEAVKDVIGTHSKELGTQLFTLTDPEMLPMVTNSMSVHNYRRPNWAPDTADGNLAYGVTRQSLISDWETSMKDLINAYDEAKEWRDELIQLAQPEVILLALCRWAASKGDDPIPAIAIDNVLRSHPNIVPIQQTIGRMPERLGRLQSL